MTLFNRKKKAPQRRQAPKKATTEVKATDSRTPYQYAYDEWSMRIGRAREQLTHWRLAAIFSMLIAILLLVVLIQELNTHKQYVYVAKIQPGQTVAQLKVMPDVYQPSRAQKEYFIGKFIQQIMSLPLDPVIARNNWFSAYRAVSARAVKQLTAFARRANPLVGIGATTKTVKIGSIDATGNNSYTLSWQQTTYKPDGKIASIHEYNGLFTVMLGPKPDNVTAMMENPLGLRIVYFNITKEE